ncbi:MAG: carboxypeptidase-like regulatory domain-containing protein [Bacteroidota bacterium]
MKKKRLAAITYAAMRITSLQIILTAFFSVSLHAKELHSQTVLEKDISILADKKEIKKVLASVTTQTGVHFIYSSDKVDIKKKISCTYEIKKLGDFFDQVLLPVGIGYKIISNDQVMLFRSDTQLIVKDILLTDIFGTVTNEKGEPMAGVSVRLKGSVTGTTTDNDGKFTISVPGDNGILEVSYVGYQQQEIVYRHPTNYCYKTRRPR